MKTLAVGLAWALVSLSGASWAQETQEPYEASLVLKSGAQFDGVVEGRGGGLIALRNCGGKIEFGEASVQEIIPQKSGLLDYLRAAETGFDKLSPSARIERHFRLAAAADQAGLRVCVAKQAEEVLKDLRDLGEEPRSPIVQQAAQWAYLTLDYAYVAEENEWYAPVSLRNTGYLKMSKAGVTGWIKLGDDEAATWEAHPDRFQWANNYWIYKKAPPNEHDDSMSLGTLRMASRGNSYENNSVGRSEPDNDDDDVSASEAARQKDLKDRAAKGAADIRSSLQDELQKLAAETDLDKVGDIIHSIQFLKDALKLAESPPAPSPPQQ